MKKFEQFRDGIDRVNQDWFNSITNEVSNTITKHGQVLTDGNDNQLAVAMDLASKNFYYDIDHANTSEDTIVLKRRINPEANIDTLINGITVIFTSPMSNTSSLINLQLGQIIHHKKPIKFVSSADNESLTELKPNDLIRGYTYLATYRASEGGAWVTQLLAYNQGGGDSVSRGYIDEKFAQLNAKIDKHKPPVGQIIYVAKDATHLGYLRLDGRKYLQTDYPDLFTYMFNEEPERRRTFNVWNFEGGVFRIRKNIIDDVSAGYDLGDKHPAYFRFQGSHSPIDIPRPLGHFQYDKLRQHQHKYNTESINAVSSGFTQFHSTDATSSGDTSDKTGNVISRGSELQGYDDPSTSPEAHLYYGLDETRMSNFTVDALIYAGRYRGIDD